MLENPIPLGSVLRQIRRERGLAVVDLAKLCAISPSSLYKTEAGRVPT